MGGWLAGTGAGSDSLFFHQAGELCKTEEAQRGTKHQMDRVASTTKTMQTSHHGVKARLTNVRLFWFGSKSVTWLLWLADSLSSPVYLCSPNLF